MGYVRLRIRELADKKGWSLKDVSDHSGVNYNTVKSYVQRGTLNTIDLSAVYKPDSNMLDVVRAVAKITGRAFTMNSLVAGKITVIGHSRTPKVEDVYEDFLMALAKLDLMVVPGQRFYRIVPLSTPAQACNSQPTVPFIGI